MSTTNNNKSEMSKEQIDVAVAVEMMEMLHREQKMKIKPADRDYEEIVKDRCEDGLVQMYGDNIPKEARERADKEISIINEHGYGALFYAAAMVAEMVKENGGLVGFRGTLGSSFAAYLLKITEVNPLSEALGGFDLPCEFFFEYDGDKEPEIMLDVSGDDETAIISYLGTAFPGFHAEIKYWEDDAGNRSIHQTKILIIPDDCSKYADDFYADGPAFRNNFKVSDYDFYDDILDYFICIKIYGNSVLNKLNKLRSLTGVYPDTNTVRSEETISLVFNRTILEIIPDFYSKTLALVEIVGVECFDDFITAFSLEHDMHSWKDISLKKFCLNGATRDGMIKTREEVFRYLIGKGVERKSAYKIADYVRKGKALRGKPETWQKYVEIMEAAEVPECYIRTIEEIKYLVPEAYCINMFLQYMRLVYYKVYYPDAFEKVYNDKKDF